VKRPGREEVGREKESGGIPTLSSKNGAIFGRVDVRVGGREGTDNTIALLIFMEEFTHDRHRK